MCTAPVRFGVKRKSVYRLHTPNAFAISLSTAVRSSRRGYLEIRYVRSFTFQRLPWSAYRFERVSDPNPTRSFTPHRGSDISCIVSLSSSPVTLSPAKLWNSMIAFSQVS